MKQTTDIISAIQSAYTHIQQKHPQQALAILLPYQEDRHPDLHYLTGICFKELGNWSMAINSLQRAMSLAPERTEVLSHIAKCYWLSGDLQQAEAHYLKILSLDPHNREILKNVSLLYLEQNQFKTAAEWAHKGQTIDDSGQFTKILGDIYKAQGDLEKAIYHYMSVPQDSPIAFRAIHNLGVCYKLQTKFEQAIQCFQFVHQQAPKQYEPLHNLGDCYFATSQFNQAQWAYNQALALVPYHTAVHKALNELYWQNGQHYLFTTSILNVLDEAENKLELTECLAELYWNTGQYEACKQCITSSGYQDSSALMLTLQGRLAAKEEHFDIALDHLNKANQISPNNDRICEQAKFAIQLGKFEVAKELLDKVLQSQPNSQLALAWLSVVYQATNQTKHDDLCDPNFVLTTELQAPEGYTNQEAFLQELESCLLKLHQGKQAPSEQTLVNGSQISGGLLNRDIEVIAKTRTQLLNDVEKRLEALSVKADHPFLSHLRANKMITGSWSVKLTEQGFHVSHIHPAGWISVVLYINTPDDNSESGVIEFGRPPLAPPYDFPPFKIVKPKRGQIVIFPSYFWHGTQPFTATENDYRMTLPLDIGVLTD